MDLGAAVALLAVGVAAGAVNTLAGAGSMLVLPSLILLGYPAHVANATNRVGVVAQAVSAAGAFRRRGALLALEPSEWAPAMVGAVAGAWLSLRVGEVGMQQVVSLILVLTLPTLWAEPAGSGRWPAPARAAANLAVGAYAGFIQAGVGFLVVATQLRGHGRDLRQATVAKVLLTAVYNVPALVVFLWSGAVDPVAGVLLAAGGAVGAWWGAAWSQRIDLVWLRRAVAFTALALAGRLLWGG